MLLLLCTECLYILPRLYYGHLITPCVSVPGPHVLISHYYSSLEFSWVLLNVYSSREILESVFKGSKMILRGFSLELHFMYRLIWGENWVLHNSESQVRMSLCVSVCHRFLQCLFLSIFVGFAGFMINHMVLRYMLRWATL